MEYETIEINKENVNDYIGLDIVAFHWSAPGACGEHGGVIFITSDGNVYHTNYVSRRYEITPDDVYKLFPPITEFQPGIVGGGWYPPEWKDQYLGLGNYLVVHESIWEEFTKNAKSELTRRNISGNNFILYNVWVDVVLELLKDKEGKNNSNVQQ